MSFKIKDNFLTSGNVVVTGDVTAVNFLGTASHATTADSATLASNSSALEGLSSSQFLRADVSSTLTNGSVISGSDGHAILQVAGTDTHLGDYSRTSLTLASATTPQWRANATTYYSLLHSGSTINADQLGGQVPSFYASTSYVDNAVSNLVDSAPATLDTLNELAAALGDDPNFATTVSTSLGNRIIKTGADSFVGPLTHTGSSEALIAGGIRGNDIGSQTGDYLHLYERVHVGCPSGWGSSVATAPSNGLSTWGGAEFNIGSVAGAPFTFGGNTIWHSGNGGSGSGLDADLLDGLDSNRFGSFSDEVHGVVSGGWVTIAYSGGSRGFSEIIVGDISSGMHNFLSITWSRAYAGSDFTVTGHTYHGYGITGVRIIQDTTDTTYGMKKLQIFCIGTLDIYVRLRDYNRLSGYTSIGASTPVTEDLPTNFGVLKSQTSIGSSSVVTSSPITTPRIEGFGTNTDFLLRTNNTSASNADQFYIKHNGANIELGNYRGYIGLMSNRVGILTSTPGYTLDVNGTANATTLYENNTLLSDKYLAKAGGTMSGTLTLGSGQYIKGADDHSIIQQNGDTTYVGSINRSNLSLVSVNNPITKVGGVDYTLWHSGNDGSGSGLDADTLDGQHASAFSVTGHNHNYVASVDDRDMKPNTSGIGATVKAARFFFSSLEGMTGTAGTDYQDVMVLDTYSDTSGGLANALVFDKSYKLIRHYQAAQDATTWGTPETLAYLTSTVDNANNLGGVGSGSYLRSDVDDICTGNINFTNTGCTLPSHYYHNVYSGQYVYAHSYPSGFDLNSTSTSYIWRSSNGVGGTSVMEFQGGENKLVVNSISTNAITVGYLYRGSHQTGLLVGGYNNIGDSSIKSSPIYAIGTSYLPNENDIGNMYGIGYTHTNASFLTNVGTGSWGMYVCAGGVASTFISGATNGSTYFNNSEIILGGTADLSSGKRLQVHGDIYSSGKHYGESFWFTNDQYNNTGISPIGEDALGIYAGGQAKASFGTTVAILNTNLNVGSVTRSASSAIRVLSADAYNAGFEAYGNSQGTGYCYVGQSTTYGGGMYYNGDGSPSFANGETADNITFYRMSAGTKTAVFQYAHSSSNVTFHGNVTAPIFYGALSGNANTASKLLNARTITLSGDVTGSTSFDGSGNVTISTVVSGGSSPWTVNGTNSNNVEYTTGYVSCGKSLMVGTTTTGTAPSVDTIGLYLSGFTEYTYGSAISTVQGMSIYNDGNDGEIGNQNQYVGTHYRLMYNYSGPPTYVRGFVGTVIHGASYGKCAIIGAVSDGSISGDSNDPKEIFRATRFNGAPVFGVGKENPYYAIDAVGDVNVTGTLRVNGADVLGNIQSALAEIVGESL